MEHGLVGLLFATGLFAGCVDAIAGGGGLICLPVLLSVGLPPHVALGTNMVQASVGTGVATYSYYKDGLLLLQVALKGLGFGFVGTVGGGGVGTVPKFRSSAEDLTSDHVGRFCLLLVRAKIRHE